MIKNLLSQTEWYCVNHGEPIPLYVYTGSHAPFYACGRYMLKDEEHPHGHENGETQCRNRLSFSMAITIVDRIQKIIEDAVMNSIEIDLKGYAFSYRGIDVKVLSWDGVKLKIGVNNKADTIKWF